MLPPPRLKNNLASGIGYYSEGLRLVWRKELRLYLIVPLVVNCFLFITLTSIFLGHFSDAVNWLESLLPDFLAIVTWITVVVLAILFAIVYAYSFNLITNIIAAPFYGMLAAKTEEILTGNPPPDEPIGQMIARTFFRELGKLWYFLTRGLMVTLIIILFGTIPGINLVAPLIGLAWSAWAMSIQYADYAADNHQLKFKPFRSCLWQKKFSCLGFGGVTMLCSVVPVLNIIAMPVAVVGGTIFWLRELKHCPEGGYQEITQADSQQ